MLARVLTAVCVLLAAASALSTRHHTTSTSRPPSIPSGYTYQARTGSYYKYHHGSWVTWDVAKSTCASEGAHLVVLNNAEEARVVADLVRDITGVHHFTWSGLRDERREREVDWRTVNGEALSSVYNVWDEGHPKNDARWTCALYEASTTRLVDAPCDFNYHFICEICH